MSSRRVSFQVGPASLKHGQGRIVVERVELVMMVKGSPLCDDGLLEFGVGGSKSRLLLGLFGGLC